MNDLLIWVLIDIGACLGALALAFLPWIRGPTRSPAARIMLATLPETPAASTAPLAVPAPEILSSSGAAPSAWPSGAASPRRLVLPLAVGAVAVVGILIALALLGSLFGDEKESAEDATFVFSGRVVDGPISFATVRFFALSNDAKGDLLAETTTDIGGWFEATVLRSHVGPILVEASGGNYTDDLTSENVTLAEGEFLEAVLEGLPEGLVGVGLAVTPLTHAAAARALTLIREGADASVAIASSNAGVAAQFGIPDILHTRPGADLGLGATAEEIQYGILLAGVSVVAAALEVRSLDVAHLSAQDASDGMLDGTKGDAPLALPPPRPDASGVGAQIQTALAPHQPSGAGRAWTTNATAVGLAAGVQVVRQAAQAEPLTAPYAPPLAPVPIGVNSAGVMYAGANVLPAWTSGHYAEAPLVIQGGTGPLSCVPAPGSVLPQGFTLTAACRVLGTAPDLPPHTSIRLLPPFLVRVTDAGNPAQTRDVTVTISVRLEPIEFLPEPLTCEVGVPCRAFVGGWDGVVRLESSYRFDTFRRGLPPHGATLSYDGWLSVTVDEEGEWTFGVCVVDAAGRMDCDDVTLSVTEPEEDRQTGTAAYAAYRYNLDFTLTGTYFHRNEHTPDGPSEYGTSWFEKRGTFTLKGRFHDLAFTCKSTYATFEVLSWCGKGTIDFSGSCTYDEYNGHHQLPRKSMSGTGRAFPDVDIHLNYDEGGQVNGLDTPSFPLGYTDFNIVESGEAFGCLFQTFHYSWAERGAGGFPFGGSRPEGVPWEGVDVTINFDTHRTDTANFQDPNSIHWAGRYTLTRVGS